MKTPLAMLLPDSTGHFFKWALPQAKVREELASLTTADMYPATADQVAELKKNIQTGFPPAEDVPLREAAKVVFGDIAEGVDVPLLGGDAL